MEPASQLFSIVLVGDLNPKIFQPAWFGRESILRKGEADTAKIEIIHPDIVVFTLDWLRIEVTRERFTAQTELDPYDKILRDLVLSTFQKLTHTPLHAMGINRHMHFEVESEEKWNEIGNILAPKSHWNSIMNDPGLNKIVMIDKKRDNGYNGFLRITLEASEKHKPGFFFTVNDHYEVSDKESSLGAEEMLSALEHNWDASIRLAIDKATTLMEGLV